MRVIYVIIAVLFFIGTSLGFEPTAFCIGKDKPSTLKDTSKIQPQYKAIPATGFSQPKNKITGGNTPTIKQPTIDSKKGAATIAPTIKVTPARTIYGPSITGRSTAVPTTTIRPAVNLRTTIVSTISASYNRIRNTISSFFGKKPTEKLFIGLQKRVEYQRQRK